MQTGTRLGVGAVAVLTFLAAGGVMDAAEPAATCPAEMPGQTLVRPVAEGDMGIRFAVQDASARNGIKLRIEMTNPGPEPRTLRMCPRMQLCCVLGLHPCLTWEKTGMGLLDLCVDETPPTPREVFLPVNASFAFDLTIPADRLPDERRSAGKEVGVYLAFQQEAGVVIETLPVNVTLKE